MRFHVYESLIAVIVLPLRFRKAKKKNSTFFKPFESYHLGYPFYQENKVHQICFFSTRNKFSEDEMIVMSSRRAVP